MIPTGTSTKVNQFPINSCQGDSYIPPQSIDKFETRGRTPCLHTCHQISAQLTCVRPLYMTVFRENMIPTGTSTKVNQFPINSCQGDSYSPPQSIDKFETRGRTPCLHTCHQISAQLTCVRPLYMTVFRENMIPTGTSTKVNQFPINSCQGDSYIPPQSIDKFETRGRTPCLHTCHQISAQLTCVRPLYMTVFREI
ncbi:hypothetical protein TNCT_183691 [Trichonephila clavata]|uniref:Uncharacterized protein n=2 Tax=Trichonephila clavata TaxID=2740835 RepID=A0A8X6GVL9_TRICU|nr:hypothetical protein TNCT_183691 [Trichonephila clavata]